MSEQNGFVSLDFLTSYKAPPPVERTIEAWGKKVMIRKLSAREYEQVRSDAPNVGDQQFAAVARSLCNQDGTPLFGTPYIPEFAIKMIGRQGKEPFDQLWEAFVEVNGLAPVEDLAKNSPEAESGSSATN